MYMVWSLAVTGNRSAAYLFHFQNLFELELLNINASLKGNTICKRSGAWLVIVVLLTFSIAIRTQCGLSEIVRNGARARARARARAQKVNALCRRSGAWLLLVL